jgi:hypothetical protein
MSTITTSHGTQIYGKRPGRWLKRCCGRTMPMPPILETGRIFAGRSPGCSALRSHSKRRPRPPGKKAPAFVFTLTTFSSPWRPRCRIRQAQATHLRKAS